MAARSAPPKRVRNHHERPLIWPPLKIGLRGAAGEAPENTLASFELALREGAEGVILDVQLSSDGVPVVICDSRLSRTTSGRGWVRDKQANALIQLDAGSWFNHRFPARARRQYAREPVPLLFEVLHWIRDRKYMALVAINHPSEDLEVKVLKEIDRAKVRHLTRVIAYNLRGLRRLRQLDAKINLGLRIASHPGHPRVEGGGRRGGAAPLEKGLAILHSPRTSRCAAGHPLDGGQPAPDAPYDPGRRGRNHHKFSGEADRNRGAPPQDRACGKALSGVAADPFSRTVAPPAWAGKGSMCLASGHHPDRRCYD